MGLQTKTIGRVTTDHGPYDPNLAYGKKFQCELFGCVWESLHDNNNTAPAVWDGGDTITPNLVDWKKQSGSYEAWLMNKDKPAASMDYPYNGMGRITIPKNIQVDTSVDPAVTTNILDPALFNKANTVYVIKYDFTIFDVVKNKACTFTSSQISLVKTPEKEEYDAATEAYNDNPTDYNLRRKNEAQAAYEAIGSQDYYYWVAVQMEANHALHITGRAVRLNASKDDILGTDFGVIFAETDTTVYIGCLSGSYNYIYDSYITIPDNCVLQFEGGSINGGTLVGNKTIIHAGLERIFGSDTTIRGTWANEGHIRWFGAHTDNQDNTSAIQKALNSFYEVVVDNGVYNVASTLYSGACGLLKGCDTEYSNSTLVFSGTGTLLMLDSSHDSFQYGYGTSYVKVEGITFFTSEKQSDYVHKPGTTAINSAKASAGEIGIIVNLCRIEGYEIGINSKHNSYYNKITNNRIVKVRYPIKDIHSNNLQINNNRLSEFEIGIDIIGGGPANICNNSFEVFSRHILRATYNGGVVNFNENYIEDYGAENLPAGYTAEGGTNKYGGAWCIYGTFMSFSAIGNLIDIPYSKRLFTLKTNKFVSQMNGIRLSSSSPITFLYYLPGKFNNEEIQKLDYISIHDDCVISGDTVPSYYEQATFRAPSTVLTVVDVIDPVLNELIPNTQDAAGYPANGYTYYGDNLHIMPRFTVDGKSILLSGVMKKTGTATDVDQPIMEIPEILKGYIGRLGYNDAIFLRAITPQGEDVLLKYIYSDGYFYFISGNNTHDIDLNGLVIPAIV